jgi:hypothetical protein
MSRLYTIVKMIWQTLRRSPGAAITIQVESGLGESREIEYYQLPGISAGPTPQDRAATIEMNGFRVAVGSHNYRVAVEPTAGELIIYSTDADGSAAQAMVRLAPDGKISISNTAADLTTVLTDLIDELIAFRTTGSPTNHTADPGTIANLNLIKTDLGLILAEAP